MDIASDHDLSPSFLEVWMGNGHGHSFPLPEGSRELVAIVGGCGSYLCLLGRWRDVVMVTPISIPKGIRGKEKISMAGKVHLTKSCGEPYSIHQILG